MTLSSPSSHSLPLEIARETGLVGLVLVTVAGVRTLPGILRQPRWHPTAAYLAITAATMPLSGFAGVITLAWFTLISPPASVPAPLRSGQTIDHSAYSSLP